MITIIIPFWNRNNVIDRCISSVIYELHESDEIIVIDDGSEEFFVSKFKEKIIYEKLENNSGPVTARLKGVNKAKNNYVIFLDSDDEFIPGWRNKVINAQTENTEKAIFFPIKSHRKHKRLNIRDCEQYWEWVGDEEREIDYTPMLHKDLASKIFRPLRVSEMWFFINIFEIGETAIYYDESICEVNNDAGNQISKIRQRNNNNFDELDALIYTLKKFQIHKKSIYKYAKKHYYAWRKYLFKKIIINKKPKFIKYII